jgi:hypothetical protein
VQDWQPALEIVSKLPGIREVQTYGEALHVLVDSGAQRLAEIRTALAEADIAVRSMRIAPARMEDVFLSVMGQLEEP